MRTHELINKAADLIEATGWTQGAGARDAYGNCCFVNPGANDPEPVCFCASGAITRVFAIERQGFTAGGQKLESRAHKALNAATSYLDIIAFNDAPGRSADEVVAVLRTTAAKLAAEEEAVDAALLTELQQGTTQ